MPVQANRVFFPEMSLTLIRRATAKLPFNHYLFKTEPKWTKLEIKEYLEKVYNVKVARIATAIVAGKIKRVPNKPQRLYRTKTEKKVFVRLLDDAAAAAKPELR